MTTVQDRALADLLPEANVSNGATFWRPMFTGELRKGSPGYLLKTEIVTYVGGAIAVVNKALHRDSLGRLDGVLFLYPGGLRDRGAVIKSPGEYSIAVLPQARHKGVGRTLLTLADRKWGIDFLCQHYTPEGRALAASYLSLIDHAESAAVLEGTMA